MMVLRVVYLYCMPLSCQPCFGNHSFPSGDLIKSICIMNVHLISLTAIKRLVLHGVVILN